MSFAYLYTICSSHLSDVEDVQPIRIPSPQTNTILYFLRHSRTQQWYPQPIKQPVDEDCFSLNCFK
jgi:hypothetical protein